jgi:hypothetical protein
MSLSLKKIQSLLSKNGLIDQTYFAIGGTVNFIEVIIPKHAESMIIEIPSKYNVRTDDVSDSRNIFWIEPIELVESETADPDMYGEVDDGQDISNTEDIEETLSRKYDKPVPFGIIDSEHTDTIRTITKQLERLNLCTSLSVYSTSIFYKDYLVCNESDAYRILDYKGGILYKLVPLISLADAVNTIATIDESVRLIVSNIQQVVVRNVPGHIRNLKRIFDSNASLPHMYSTIVQKNANYELQIAKFSRLKMQLSSFKADRVSVLEKYRFNDSDVSIKTLHNDLESSRVQTNLRLEIEQMTRLEDDINTEIMRVKDVIRHNNLCMDEVCFANSILVSNVNKNFKKLSDIR